MYATGSTGASVNATSEMHIEADRNQSIFAVLLCITMERRACISSLRRKLAWVTFVISVAPNNMYVYYHCKCVIGLVTVFLERSS